MYINKLKICSDGYEMLGLEDLACKIDKGSPGAIPSCESVLRNRSPLSPSTFSLT